MQNHETFCIYEKKVETVKVYNLTNINRTNNHLSLQLIKAKKKYMCVSDRPTAPKIFYAKKKKIDRQNPEIRLRFRVCFRLQQFSSFPCTFDRCLEPKNIVLHVK